MRKINYKAQTVIIAFMLILVTALCSAEEQKKVPPNKQESQSSVSILQNDKPTSGKEIEVKEMSLKEKLLAQLKEEHAKGNFLDISEELIQGMTDEEIMKILDATEQKTENLENQPAAMPTEGQNGNEESGNMKKAAAVTALAAAAGLGARYGGSEEEVGKEPGDAFRKATKDVKETIGSEEYNKGLAEYYKKLEEKGICQDKEQNKMISKICNRLQEHGGYCMKEDSPEFKTAIINDNIANATCNAENYIAVNKGLVSAMKNNEDMIAAVLAHELTHGEHQDMVRTMAYIQLTGDDLKGSKVLKDKEIEAVTEKRANHVMTIHETSADSAGFYHLAEAGYNPGAQAAAFIRLGEYAEWDSGIRATESTVDHPATQQRVQDSFDRLNKYSNGRVEVKQTSKYTCEVRMDGKKVFSGANEKACFKAGDLARECHNAVS